MNKLKRQSIADSINGVTSRCIDAFSSYRPYQPTLDHEAALKFLDEAQRHLEEAREKILSVHQSSNEIPPQLNKHDVVRLLPRYTEIFILLAAGRVMIKGTYDEVKDFAEKLAMPVGTVVNMVNVVEWQ